MNTQEIKPPFPYFGGKSRAAALIWSGIGDVDNYIEPFAGSLAVLLRRPHEPKIETVNDLDSMICNFWRAVRHSPDAVAEHADWPVVERDLEARHYWLVTEGRAQLAALMTTPDGHDAKIAGWWVWGACAWIGSGWCSGEGPWAATADGWSNLSNAGRGVNRKLPHLGAGRGVNRKLPHLGGAGRGVNRQLPHLSNAGQGEHPHRAHLIAYMRQLADRLRYVRVACGDWRRVLTPSVTHGLGVTGVVLDPPYGIGEVDYAAGGNKCAGIADAVRRWAIENGDHADMRIALCGYEGQHDMPESWRVEEWKAVGGYSSTAAQETQGQLNRHRERVWFSPHCANNSMGLFAD